MEYAHNLFSAVGVLNPAVFWDAFEEEKNIFLPSNYSNK